MEHHQEARPSISKYKEIIESPHDNSGPLTFGIELEFVLAYLDLGPDPDPQDQRPPLRVFRGSSGGYSNNVSREIVRALKAASDLPFRREADDEYEAEYLVRYNQWRLVTDFSVYHQDPLTLDGYNWVGKEITSVVMRSDEPQAYTQKITDVCRAIRQMRVTLNKTTSVHVHVGRGEESFSLLTMKKLGTLIFLTDKMLLGLHHPARQTSTWCSEFLEGSNLQKKTDQAKLTGENPLSEAQAEEMDEFVPQTHPLEMSLI